MYYFKIHKRRIQNLCTCASHEFFLVNEHLRRNFHKLSCITLSFLQCKESSSTGAPCTFPARRALRHTHFKRGDCGRARFPQSLDHLRRGKTQYIGILRYHHHYPSSSILDCLCPISRYRAHERSQKECSVSFYICFYAVQYTFMTIKANQHIYRYNM